MLAPFAVKVTREELHIVGEAGEIEMIGRLMVVTATVALPEQPLLLVPTTVYTVLLVVADVYVAPVTVFCHV